MAGIYDVIMGSRLAGTAVFILPACAYANYYVIANYWRGDLWH